MLWNQILKSWEDGNPFEYPSRLNNKFQWNTSVLKNNGNVEFKQKFKSNKQLPDKHNTKSFREYLTNSTNKYVVSFLNPSKDTLLIIPKTRPGKNYATIKDFVDNAPKIQQVEFWKEAAVKCRKQMEEHKKVWVSAHGLGVPYFHLRIATKPKYYFDEELSQA